MTGYMPKNYDPIVTPYPKRWLSMRKRSTYKAKRKNKKAVLGKEHKEPWAMELMICKYTLTL